MPGDAGELATALTAATGSAVAPAPSAAVHGGCIAECWRWDTADGPMFVKLAPAGRLAMLEAERDGLTALASAGALRVPAVRGLGASGEHCFLALEWIELAPTTPRSDERLGEQLATLHRARAARFGFERDNFMGRTVQPNTWHDDWVQFLKTRRLGHQLQLAAGAGHGGRLQERGHRLLEIMDVFFATYRPAPSLLHGDLWGGNHAADAAGNPVVFDPAVYFGDREADIAMTRLFGGFGPRFYSAYVASWPLDAAAGTRRDLYNLYHVLNHLNLFGGAYRDQAEGLIDRLLAAAGH